jgi:hypothetical protein
MIVDRLPFGPVPIEPMAEITTRFEVATDGKITLGERDADHPLIEAETDEIALSVSYSEIAEHVGGDRVDWCWLRLTTQGASADTGRAFEACLEACLPWTQLRQLHAYLGFLLAQVEKGDRREAKPREDMP